MADPDDRAYDVCYGPADATLATLVRVAGTRWAIEEGIEFVYNVQPVGIQTENGSLALRCRRTELGGASYAGRAALQRL